MRIIFGIVLTAILSFGSFCAIDLYKDYNKGNKILNDYSYEELYKDFQIDDVTLGKDTVFYKVEDGKYAYTKIINKYIDFDGTANKYNLIINDRPCNVTSSAYGTLYAKYNLNYYDIYGKEITNTPLEFYYTFYQDKIEIRITATATEKGYAHLSNYLERRGLHLVLCQEVYNPDISEALERVFVKYSINGNITTTSIAYGSSLLPPTPPTIEGKTFKGWSDGTGLVDLNTYKALKNTTLTAVYEANKYTVTFKNGNTVLSTQTVEYGNNATEPDVVVPTGYRFNGWDKSLNNITADTVISAVFEKLVYTIEYYGDNEALLESRTYVIGDSIAYSAPAVTGYTFKSWNTNNYAYYPEYDITLDTLTAEFIDTYISNPSLTLQVYARYTINTYTVTFKNGNTVLSTQTVAYNNNATAPTVTPEIGYTHSGWDKSLNNITEDTVISATFNKIQYTITFYDCDQRDTSTVLGSEVFVIGDTINFAFETPQGYTFDGWSLDMYGLTADLPTSFTLDTNRILHIFPGSTISHGLIAHCTVNNYTLTFTDSYLKARQDSSTGTVLTTGCSLPYGTRVYLSATRSNYAPTIKVNGVTKSNNSTITITNNTTITVSWTSVEPAKSWKTVSTSNQTLIGGSYNNKNSVTIKLSGLTESSEIRITVSYSFTDYAGNSASDDNFVISYGGSSSYSCMTPFSEDGDYILFSIKISEGQIVITSENQTNGGSARLVKIEQYC